ncbi:hypothetical protein FDUTEX481_04944 [Tolypothrix sp. PCC 7601]|nr:hypothetical protein FDUTEX481_04944 [Tolypothrix sp. PCC 7601]
MPWLLQGRASQILIKVGLLTVSRSLASRYLVVALTQGAAL